MHAINPAASAFGDYRRRFQFLFRGQSNASWQLLPSSLRKPRFYIDGRWTRPLRATNRGLIGDELSSARAFFAAVDQLGLPIPEDSQKLRELLTYTLPESIKWSRDESIELDWPPIELISLLGLAQHFGFPTRLLDWTLDAHIAAYFATVGAARNFKFNEDGTGGPYNELAVWWFTTDNTRLNESRFLDSGVAGVEVVGIAESTNPAAHAQSGAFTIYHPADRRLHSPIDRTPFEELFTRSDIPNWTPSTLHKYCLPAEESPKLLRLLAMMKIDASILHPGYAGAVEALKDEKYWD